MLQEYRDTQCAVNKEQGIGYQEPAIQKTNISDRLTDDWFTRQLWFFRGWYASTISRDHAGLVLSLFFLILTWF